jgi:hypothetical protein
MCGIFRITLMSFLVTLMWGCLPYSDNPLSDPFKEPLDRSICGTWFARDKEEVVYLHIGEDFESKLLRVIMIDVHGDQNMDVSQLIGHTTEIGGNKYLNLQWARPSSEPAGFMFVKYTSDGDRLGIWVSNTSVLTDAVKKGRLKGSVDGKSSYADVRITENQDGLRRFVTVNDNELFDEMHFLKRLRLPDSS